MRTLRVGIVGVGTVGGPVAALLVDRRAALADRFGVDLRLSRLATRDPRRPRPGLPEGLTIDPDWRAVTAAPDVDVVVELVGGTAAAREVVLDALSRGKHVVTANKALLAAHWDEVMSAAGRAERAVAFEAAVAGGVPVIAAVSDSLAVNRIEAVEGILNGTSNHILSAMQRGGLSYADALALAQRAGYAEADPTLDVDGSDAAQKLALLCRLAFRAAVDPAAVRRHGIDGLDPNELRYAAELGFVVKLLAVARRLGDDPGERVGLRVGPTLVPRRHPMASVDGADNAVRVVADPVGETFYSGPGAGGRPTAASVLADVVAVGTGLAERRAALLQMAERSAGRAAADPAAFLASRFYLRFTIVDRPGVLGRIASVLGGHGISIASVIQHEPPAGAEGVPLVIMTHRAGEGAVRRALAEADALETVTRPAVALPVAD